MAVLAGVGCFWFFGKDEEKKYLTEKAQKGEIKKTVSITGSVVSEKPVGLNFEIAGRIKEIKKEAGQEAAEGEVIAVLEDKVLSKQLEKAGIALQKARAESKTNNDSVREAEEKVDNAEDYLEAAEDYYDERVEAAEMEHQNAADYYKDALSYYDKVVEESGEDSSTAKSAKMTLTKAESSKEQSQQALKIAKKNRRLNVVSAENSLSAAEELLVSAQSDYAQQSRDASVAAAQKDYEIALNKVEEASLKSPVNGLVSEINYEEGEVIGSAAGGYFGKVISKDFLIEADVPESDISEITLGQEAEVIFDAFSNDRKISAEIIDIEPGATRVQDVVYYKARFKFDAESLGIKEGMTADAEILLGRRDSVLKVPKRALEKENGNFFVKTLSDAGKAVRKQVKTGLDGDQGYIEIKEGLKEGEKIIVSEKGD